MIQRLELFHYERCMKFLCGLVENVCNHTRSFWDFRYLKVNCNLCVKRKLNCRRLFGKLRKNNRHPMVETSEAFFLMKLLQQNIKSSRSKVFCKKGVLKTFPKLTGKYLCRSLFFIWDYRNSSTGVFLRILRNFYKRLTCRTSRNGSYWNAYIISLLKIILSNLSGNISIQCFAFFNTFVVFI